jgi:hypothetical protein
MRMTTLVENDVLEGVVGDSLEAFHTGSRIEL